jgi:hypothetical protein
MDNGNIRWDQPIEAVHEDGRVQGVCLRQDMSCSNPDGYGDYYTTGEFGGYDGIWRPNGASWCGMTPLWTIRNVAEAKAVEAPETHRQGTNGVRTGVEALERYEGLYERMAGLVREMASQSGPEPRFIERAKAIVRDLPEPVDPDLIECRNIGAEIGKKHNPLIHIMNPQCWHDGQNDDTHKMELMLAAIKRGRALERGEG